MLRDVLGDHATEDLLAELNSVYQQVKVLGWKELRPWSEFFAVFKTPQLTLKHVEQRIATNALYYRSNYVAVCCAILILQIIRAPIVLLTVVLVTTLCAYLLIIVKGSFNLGEVEINELMKRMICAVLSVLLLAVTGTLEHLIWSLLYCILICGLHMIFRPRNVSSKTNRVYEEAKMASFNWFGDGDKSDDLAGNDDPENPRSRHNSGAGTATTQYFPATSGSSRRGFSESKGEESKSDSWRAESKMDAQQQQEQNQANVFSSFEHQYGGGFSGSRRNVSVSAKSSSKAD